MVKQKDSFWDKYSNTLFYALLGLVGALAMITFNFQVKGVEANSLAIKESTMRDNAIHREMINTIVENTKVNTALVEQVKSIDARVEKIETCLEDNKKDLWRLKAKTGIIQ